MVHHGTVFPRNGWKSITSKRIKTVPTKLEKKRGPAQTASNAYIYWRSSKHCIDTNREQRRKMFDVWKEDWSWGSFSRRILEFGWNQNNENIHPQAGWQGTLPKVLHKLNKRNQYSPARIGLIALTTRINTG